MWTGRHLFATCSSGLSNRLLVLAGCMRVAEQTGRKLWLYWPVNNDLGCSFADLFTNEFKTVKQDTMMRLFDTAATVKIYNAWKTNEPLSNAIQADGDPDINIVVVKAWTYPMFEQEPFSPALTNEVRGNLLRFTPRPEIAAVVDSFSLHKRVIGVHIRRADNMKEFGQSTDEHFLAIIRVLRQRAPGAQFFLSTDTPECEGRFRQELGDAMVSTAKTWQPRRHPDNAREGLIDLLLLSRTDGIIGTHRSSFSQLAACLGDKPLVVANEQSAGADLAKTCAALLPASDTTRAAHLPTCDLRV